MWFHLEVWLMLSALFVAGCSPNEDGETTSTSDPASIEFTAMAWNILHGGRDDGEHAGPQRVIDVIRDSGADIVAMQETYGSGELISAALEFHFHPRGTNVSIHSRFPIIEDLSVFEEFKCVGALLELPDASRLAFYSIWLPYGAEIWEAGTRDGKSAETLAEACEASRRDLEQLVAQLTQRLAGPAYADVPIVIAGDFNSMSHFDYTEAARAQYGVVIDWATSRLMTENGFTDTYRALHPTVDRARDRTWTPRFPEQEQDRIDFIYIRGPGLRATSATLVDTHHEKFPSDHAAVQTVFRTQHN